MNVPTATAAKPEQLVRFWRRRVKELKSHCAEAEAAHSFTALATLARQITQAEVALIDAQAAVAAEKDRASSSAEAMERLVLVVARLPQSARDAFRARVAQLP